MVIRQGDIFWVDLQPQTGSAPAYRRPCVVIQNNVFNVGRIATVIVCLLTTNLRRAAAPGNVLLSPGEGNLPQQSVVNVTQLITLDKAQLDEWIGTLSAQRVRQILDGIALVLEPRDVGDIP
jgi:mRNA interferase MazF